VGHPTRIKLKVMLTLTPSPSPRYLEPPSPLPLYVEPWARGCRKRCSTRRSLSPGRRPCQLRSSSKHAVILEMERLCIGS
jgi:hypothetical protein